MTEREEDLKKIRIGWAKISNNKDLMAKVLTAYMKKHFSKEVRVIVDKTEQVGSLSTKEAVGLWNAHENENI